MDQPTAPDPTWKRFESLTDRDILIAIYDLLFAMTEKVTGCRPHHWIKERGAEGYYVLPTFNPPSVGLVPLEDVPLFTGNDPEAV
jgi:hypothetical protein